jgi:hypothetical protein
MKKILLLLLLAGGMLTLQAQKRFIFGPKAGFNMNTLSVNVDTIRAGIDNSLQAGVFVRLGGRFYVQPEATYQVVSGTLTQLTGGSSLSQEYKIQALRIPLILGYQLISKEMFNLRVLAGPSFTYAINKKLNPPVINDLWPIHSTDDLKDGLWAIQAGAGFDLLFLTVDVRYEKGIGNLYSGEQNLDMKNSLFNISVGIKLL